MLCLQICVRWNLQLGHSVIPKSVTDSRIIENLAVVKFEIPKAQMEELNSIKRQMRMLDGAFVCGPNTPYPTIEDLWDGEVRLQFFSKVVWSYLRMCWMAYMSVGKLHLSFHLRSLGAGIQVV